MRMRLRAIVMVALLILVAQMAMPAFADTPYRSFAQTKWSMDAASPDAYIPKQSITGIDMGAGALNEPEDFYVAANGDLYILDSGNNRVVIVDKNFKFIKEIKTLTMPDGTTSTFLEPEGIFVFNNGDVYVADTGNARVLRMDTNGKVIRQFVVPTAAAYTSKTFRPTKVIVDNIGMVYAISDTVFQGAILYTEDGKFNSFYGGAKIQVTARLLADRAWKKILNKKARSGMARYVPIEYTNFDIDPKGFVYTCSQHTNNNMEQLRKLNALGSNIYPKSDLTNFGDKQTLFHKQQTYETTFVDVTVDDKDFMIGLDITRGRVYMFDGENNQLFTFGTTGDQLGAFQKSVAVDTWGETIMVLDGQKGSITTFLPSEYGALIREATITFNDGRYEEAMAPWTEVLALNNNYELAYIGMGEAMMKTGDYSLSVEYFRRGYDTERESRAFGEYRGFVLRNNFQFVVAICFLLMFAALILTSKKFAAFIEELRIKRIQRDRQRRAGN